MSQHQKPGPVRIYVDLIGDLFHAGDAALLRQARRLGDHLVVGVLSDPDAALYSHTPVMTLEERIAVVAACRHADEVVASAPLVPDAAFLDRHAIDYVCLVSDLGAEPRREAYAALLEEGRGIVLAPPGGPTVADIVGRVVGRKWAGSARAEDAGMDAPIVHAPPAQESLAARLAALEHGQRMVLDVVAPLAAALLDQPWLFPARPTTDDHWVRLLRVAAAERLGGVLAAADDPLAAVLPATLLADLTKPDASIVLCGDQAVAVACALAGRRGPVTVLQPGTSSGFDAELPARGLKPPASVRIVAGTWSDVMLRCPHADVVAVLDERVSGALMRSARLMWHLAERAGDGLLLAAELSADAAAIQSVRGDPDRIAYSDSYVRSALHRAGFLEVRDLVSAIGGLPARSAGGRISRYTEREALYHGDHFRFIDGLPASAVDAGPEVRILRWYHARRFPFDPQAASGAADE